jgi:MarR family 2-MHQ and catechol resistance regulon transcriptional repressor
MATRHPGSRAEQRALDALIKLSRATNAVRARLERSFKEHGFTESQFGVLEALYHLGPMRHCDLGQKVLTSRANITLIVDKLEDRGLVERGPDPDDRRALRVALKPAGRKLIARLFPSHAQEVVEVFSVLSSKEQQQLGDLCRKLGRSVAEEN